MAVPFWLSADVKPMIRKAIMVLKPCNLLLKIKSFVSHGMCHTVIVLFFVSVSTMLKIINALCRNYFDSV